MGYTQQFAAMLNDLEEGEVKTTLISAFGNVKLDLEQAVEKRNIIKQEFDNYKQGVNNIVGSDKLDDLKNKISSASKDQDSDIEKIKSELKNKYEADTNELRQMLDSEKSKNDELVKTHQSIMFDINVEKQGLLKDFNTSNPKVKELVLNELREKLILEDNTFFVKDSSTGEKARDIKSGDYLSAKNIIEEMTNNDSWSVFLNAQTQATGGNTPPRNQSNVSSTSKAFNEYTSSELVALHRENPTKYNQLKEEFNRKVF